MKVSSLLFLLVLILTPLCLSACIKVPRTAGGISKGDSSKEAGLEPAPAPAPAPGGAQDKTNEAGRRDSSGLKSKLSAHGDYDTIESAAAQLRQGRYLTGIPGGKLVAVTVSEDPRSFNPWIAADSFSLELCDFMFRGLADIDLSTGEVIPDMAVEIKRDADGLTYHTRLRRGLKWSDGAPIDALDVDFTWNRLISQGYASPSLRQAAMVDGKLAQCTVENELGNKFVIASPSASFSRVLASVKIAPRHAIETLLSGNEGRAKFKELWNAQSDPAKMVTSGPFTLSSVVLQSKVEFARSENFYMVDRTGCRLPYLDTLTYLLVPDAGSVLLSFDKGIADLAQIRPRDASWMKSQQKKANFKLFNLGPVASSFFLVFNLNQRQDPKRHKAFVEPVKSSWFNDVNFRQAVNHAINREHIVKEFFKGAGTPCFSFEPQNSRFYNRSLKPFRQDLKLAQSLLSRSGFEKKSDGRLYDREGNKVGFRLSYLKRSKLYELSAGSIASDLRRLGIQVEMEALEASQVQDTADGVGHKSWEAQLFTVTADPLEPNDGAAVFLSDGQLHLFDQRDPDLSRKITVEDARPWELRLDLIYKQAAAALDEKSRLQLYCEAQKIVYDEAPLIYLVSPDVLLASRNTLKNFKPTPLSQAALGLHNVEEIYLDQGIRKRAHAD